ncbi:unnamed protein product [Brugia pahangi]|uniref:Uncharacterized protein n=1 Tax=Brugia pahangi TaxID=6280 RepID=A0A0N4TSM0_BRUPA|nr:unnamed protein product [Brugia pahangi]
MDAKSLPVYYFPEIQCTIRINKAVFSNHFRMINSFWYVKDAISFLDFNYCSRSFEVSTLLWTENCTRQSNNGGKLFLSFRHIWVIFLSISMLVMYFAILCNIRHRRTLVINDSRNFILLLNANIEFKKHLAMNTRHGTSRLETAKYERSVLIQAALTCGRTVLPMTLFATNKHARKQLYLLLKISKVE